MTRTVPEPTEAQFQAQVTETLAERVDLQTALAITADHARAQTPREEEP